MIIENMPDTIDETVSDLRSLFEQEHKARELVSGLANSTRHAEQEAMNIQKETAQKFESIIKERLTQFQVFPPHHARHRERLALFYALAKYELSVFIMSKFNEGMTQLDVELARVINAVEKSTKGCGYYPRTATWGSVYHPLLWDNVEVHLLGCSIGVAILEDRYKPEFNPNVAMEWGWMRGMGKDVLLLVENNFRHFRADMDGLIQHRFSWEEPEHGVERAVRSWLKDRPQQNGKPKADSA